MDKFDFDAIVIGSGFGGAVSACRLAEAGQRVLVLERGRRWTKETYPRKLGDPWVWDQERPHLFNGWADLRTFDTMWVVAGAGVGGGSLIYANISVEAHAEAFATGWPEGISLGTLKPYYQRVGQMLDLQEIPDNQINPRTRLMREAADKCGWGDRFRKLPLAVSFDPDFSFERDNPRDDRHSRSYTNEQGRVQGTCVHCGNCDIGCQVHAKNTLDLNYLAAAESQGATVLPLHLVQNLVPLPGGWRVECDDLTDGTCRRRSFTAKKVLLGAGSIGSTELLLRCRDVSGSLSKLSGRLGYGWAFNGDFVTPTFYRSRKIDPSHGPTISSAIDLLDRSFKGEALFIEDGGIPDLAANFLPHVLRARKRKRTEGHFWRSLLGMADAELSDMMPWFGQAVDAGDGQMYIGRPWFAPWRRELRMKWDYRRSQATVDAMVAAHLKLSAATGGEPFVPPTWTDFHRLITPHPLGGCNMGITRADGVVDGWGKVFGYDNLYVMDGAAVPRPLGLNPSRTIAALAERNIEHVIAQGCAS